MSTSNNKPTELPLLKRIAEYLKRSIDSDGKSSYQFQDYPNAPNVPPHVKKLPASEDSDVPQEMSALLILVKSFLTRLSDYDVPRS